MNTKTISVRDFIYLDTDRLYSFYSQAFEGVAERIVKSHFDAITSTNLQKDGFLTGAATEAQAAEGSRHTESRVLYDHMYNQLEDRLGNAIALPNNLNHTNFVDTLRNEFLIKVKGFVVIEDYARLEHFTSKFNRFGEIIAYATTTSDTTKGLIKDIKEQAATITDRNQKAKLLEQVKSISDPKLVAKNSGLHQEEEMLKNLAFWNQMFRNEALEINVMPLDLVDQFVFRGVVDRSWLRIKPDLLRMLYSGAVASEWTMVGQITYLPGDGGMVDKQFVSRNESKPDDPNNPSIRDPFQKMFAASRTIERMFFESRSQIEIIVCPLAIYREGSVNIGPKNSASMMSSDQPVPASDDIGGQVNRGQ